jgi:O-antigen ligase
VAGAPLRVNSLSGRTSSSVDSRPAYVVISSIPCPTTVRWSLAIFVSTLPFEHLGWAFMDGSVSIAKLAGFLFFGFYLLHHVSPFGKRSLPRIPTAMWWFLVFLAIYTVNGGLLGSAEYRGDFVSSLFQLVQLIVMLWLCSDLLKDERTARGVLLAYTIAAAVFALGILFQVPGFYVEGAEGRASAMGENPNAIAGHSANAIIIILGLFLYTSYRYTFHGKLFLIILSLPLFAAIASSGSRGGVLAFLMGGMVYLFPYRRSKRVLTAVFIATLAISATVYFVATNSDFLERWNQTYYEGSLAGREDIFAAAAEMISEQPMLGWQPVDSYYELGRRMGGLYFSNGRDVHNLYLGVLLQVGVIGAIPFFIGLWLCGRSAWRARLGNLQLLPLALLVTTLAASMSGTGLVSKSQWLIFALTLAAVPPDRGELGRRFPARLVTARQKRKKRFLITESGPS